jgi:aspartate ammonia-lyase
MRTESDLIGTAELPRQALFGIHTLRAVNNFPLTGRRVRSPLIHAYGAVKLACARANHELGYLGNGEFCALEAACREMMEGMLDEHLMADPLQGGAGTSTNMNVNEVLANRALAFLQCAPGDCDTLHPLEHVNLHQSTNDTYPTALRVAAIRELRLLETAVRELQEAFQAKEHEFEHIVKVARTECQDATLTTLGRSMGAFAEPLARDRWRIYKCEERLRVINLGGTAIGSGLGAPRRYIFRVVDILREITGLGLARAENGIDATQNVDSFVEVSGILRALATTLIKICTDLRLLSSGPDSGLGEITLPARQAGSSIMPGKVNPVIPEAATQAAVMAIAYDGALAAASGLGSLELNPFLPLIADCLLGEIELLRNACTMLRQNCVSGLSANEERCRQQIENSTAAATALVETIGYEEAAAVIGRARETGISVREAAVAMELMTAAQFDRLISPESVTRLGSPAKERI